MREYHELPIDLIDESADNPRTVFADDALAELMWSILQHGMIEPIAVRRDGERYKVIAGARRLRAARRAELTVVPVLVDDEKDAAEAELAAVAENLHRQDLTPLEEARSYQRLLSRESPAYTIEDLRAQFGKEKSYIHQRLMLLRLTPEIQDLLSGDVLPLSYALKLATVPRARQSDALDICYRPLFRDEGYRRDQLEPLATLTAWLRDNVRRDPHGYDTQMLLPQLAAQVTATELERHRTIVKVSELTFHTDRSDPDVILSKSWKPANTPEERCEHARPAIIVLGPNQDTVLDVCVAKKRCEKHWPSSTTSQEATADTSAPDDADGSDDEGAEREPAEWQKRQQEERRWEEELRPHALRLFAERATKLTWSWPMLHHLLTELDMASGPETQIEFSELADLVGALDKLPAKRYPQVLAVAFALQQSWSRDSLLQYAQQIGVSMEATDLTINVSPVDSAPADPAPRNNRKKKTAKAA
jgi:ParB/RepB/Spo0J family partition protein